MAITATAPRFFPPKVRRILPEQFRKYHIGPAIRTFDFLLDAARRGTYIFYNHKAYHASWIINWQTWRVQQLLNDGRLFMAIRNKNHPLVFEALYLEGSGRDLPAWYVRCDEIPRWTIEAMASMSMTAIINACFAKARSMGHFGRVKVVFEKEKAF